MSKKINVTQLRVRGAKMTQVQWHDETGRRRRKFFGNRAAAEAFATHLRGAALAIDGRIAIMPRDDRDKMLFAWEEAKRRNIDLVKLIASAPEVSDATATIGDVLTDLIAIKRRAGITDLYLYNLRRIIRKFFKGRERDRIDKFTLADVEIFLHSNSIGYRPTLRARLSSLFRFAIRRGYCEKNPCDQLESVKMTRPPPPFLTVDQMVEILKWFAINPKAFGWFILSTFAGLRPEEAAKTRWADIHFSEGWIKVEAQTTKVRQRRVVYPPAMVFDWLRAAEELKTKMPVGAKVLQKERWKFREVLGFKKWPPDVTRHTAASYWLSTTGDTARVASALGHSENVLKKNYMAIVTKVDAEKFWNLKPD